MRLNIFIPLLLLLVIALAQPTRVQAQKHHHHNIINIVFTSDVHYGITRKSFRGDTGVAGNIVNAAMIDQINKLPQLTLPADGGVNAGSSVGHVNYLIETGDIANRMEIPNQSATTSWQQFSTDYLHHLNIKDGEGKHTKVLLVPGNHDIANAIGYYRPMLPQSDAGSMVGICNLMMHPAKPLNNVTYNYKKDKINYSRNIGGVHFMFINLWPDSAERIWMEKDLEKVPHNQPVILFTHEQPACEAVHFTNPTPPYLIIPGNKFENLLEEHYKESRSADAKGAPTDIEQRGFVMFLKLHPNIKAYFHGHSNFNEFYVYHGPDNDVNLPVFRVDSPMKGKFSAKDESLLSFQLISLDPATQTLTARECFWNKHNSGLLEPVTVGSETTISLKVN